MTADQLFAWIMHRFAEVFEEQAIIKGGMALRLLDSPRATNDIDYVFVPYESKKEVKALIEEVLGELEDAEVNVRLHSKMLWADIRIDEVAIQIEASVGLSCPSTAMSTGALANAAGTPAQVVRIMDLGVALAHKLAAWNERRLHRDLYDAYFLFSRAGAQPDLEVLDLRLTKIQSRRPKLRAKRRMSRSEFLTGFRDAVEALAQGPLDDELGGLLAAEERAGLSVRMRAQLVRLAEVLEPT